MNLGGAVLFLLFFHLFIYSVWNSSFYMADLRNWATICKEFANSYGLICDSTSLDTSIHFSGNYAGYSFKLEVVLMGGGESVPPELNLRIRITNVGRLGDSFKITEAHLLSRKQPGLSIPKLEHDYEITGLSGNNYISLFKTSSFCESILKFHPNFLSLEKQELTFSKRVTENKLEELRGYSNFLCHIGNEINHLNDMAKAEL